MNISLDQIKGVWQVRGYNSAYVLHSMWRDIRNITQNRDYFYFQVLDKGNGAINGVITNLTDHDVKFVFFNQKFNELTGKPSADYNPIDSVLNPKQKSYHVDVDRFSNDSLIIHIDDYSEFNFNLGYYEDMDQLVCIHVNK